MLLLSSYARFFVVVDLTSPAFESEDISASVPIAGRIVSSATQTRGVQGAAASDDDNLAEHAAIRRFTCPVSSAFPNVT